MCSPILQTTRGNRVLELFKVRYISVNYNIERMIFYSFLLIYTRINHILQEFSDALQRLILDYALADNQTREGDLYTSVIHYTIGKLTEVRSNHSVQYFSITEITRSIYALMHFWNFILLIR